MQKAGEWSAEGAQKKAQAHRRREVPFWRRLNRGRTRPLHEYLSLCMGFQVAKQFWNGLQAVGKNPLHLSHTPEVVGVAHNHQGSINKHHLLPHPPQWLYQRRTLQLSAIYCCSHFPGDVHALLLPLPKALGTYYTCLKFSAASQGPATRKA